MEFKLYLIKEFQRLKDEERKQLGWDIRRNLAKINYRIHTDAIKENLIPAELTRHQITTIYASEADVLNMALFGITAKEWREANRTRPEISGIMPTSRSWCVSPTWRISMPCLSARIFPKERLVKLNTIAIHQMKLLTEDTGVRKLEEGE